MAPLNRSDTNRDILSKNNLLGKRNFLPGVSKSACRAILRKAWERGYGVAQLFWQFLIYSFLGFVLEVIFARVTRAGKQDRKCMLFLPLCPVYGLGALLIVHLPATVRSRPVLLFLLGALAATAVEYFMDWFYEKALGVRFWDYSALRWNLNGRVCLLFSGFWGLLALGLVAWVHPAVARWTAAIPSVWTLPVLLFFLLDTVFTVYLLRSTGRTASLRWYDRFRRLPRRQSQ